MQRKVDCTVVNNKRNSSVVVFHFYVKFPNAGFEYGRRHPSFPVGLIRDWKRFTSIKHSGITALPITRRGNFSRHAGRHEYT